LAFGMSRMGQIVSGPVQPSQAGRRILY